LDKLRPLEEMEKEKMKHISLTLALLTLVLNACGSKAPPTPDPVQVQASAIAAANTMIALTKAAIPTATDTPVSSPTPLPSPTLIPLPTLDIGFPTAILPTVTPQGDQGSCVHPLDMGAAGPKHPVLIKNQTGGTMNLSLNLYKPNAFGECGALSYAGVGKNDSIDVRLPSGYWYVYAWANAKGKNFTVEGYFYVQPAQSLKMELCIRTENAIFAQAC
jgi:hypothetical protein